MKIAYVCYWFLLERDGVVAKIEAQAANWRAAGHEVEVFCLARVMPERQATLPPWRTFFFGSPAGRLLRTRELVAAVEEWRPDVLYLRYDLFLPPLPRLLGAFGTAIEINANDREEARLRIERPRAAAAFNELNRRMLLSRARGLVCVTRELALSDDFASFAKPTVTIGNGVDLDRMPELPPPVNERPRIVFLGSARQRWHGVDKISLLAERMPDADFDIVGYGGNLVDFAVPPNMQVHPPLAREGYEPLLARADLAIGTLALHRKNMHEACPLKVREYLGHGLPVVIAYEDTDFAGESPWFLLGLPNEESNVRDHVDAIRAFLDRVRGRRVARHEVEERIGSRAKERRRLEFLETLTP